MTLPRIEVILVNWNGTADTLGCIDSLERSTHANVHIIVVDNASADAPAAAIRAAHPNVQVIEAGGNLGFTGGNNRGIRQAIENGADHVFLLNNDTVVEPTTIETLIRTAETEGAAGILVPVIHYFDEPQTPWFCGAKIDMSRGIAVHDNSGPPATGDQPRKLPWATGCAMFIPRRALDRLKGFDDRFFLLWEDVDLSLRAQQCGFDILLVPAARVLHKVSRSFKTSGPVQTYYYIRNHLLISRLYAGRSHAYVSFRLMAHYLRQCVENLFALRPESGEKFKMFFRALRDHARHRYGALNS